MTEIHPRILILPKWYPHRYDAMPGLFVQRQAEAVSDRCEVVVLYVHEDGNCRGKYEIVEAKEGNLTVVRVYYRRSSHYFPGIRELTRLIRFFRAYINGFQVLGSFQPDLLHVQVLTRTGIIALLYKFFKKTPYVVSEHWSRYFPENNSYQGFLRKILTKFVIRNSVGIIFVSEKLKNAMLQQGLKSPHNWIVPNVVDRNFFRPGKSQDSRLKKQVIHVSCFDERSKNITGFLHAIKNLSNKRDDFEVFLVGEGPDLEYCRKISADLGLADSFVKFLGHQDPGSLVSLMSNADFLVLSSRYETFATVVVESLACGTPVVSTDVGVVPEIINASNGIIVQAGNDKALEDGLNRMLDTSESYNRQRIRESVRDRFSSKKIGEQLLGIYNEIIKRKKITGV